jgi:hypothetical protein
MKKHNGFIEFKMHIFGKLNVDFTEEDIKYLLKNYTYYDFLIEE